MWLNIGEITRQEVMVEIYNRAELGDLLSQGSCFGMENIQFGEKIENHEKNVNIFHMLWECFPPTICVPY
eukprot:UN02058